MKKYLLLILLTISFKSFSQSSFVTDSVSLMAGYRQDVFYSLANGTVATDSSHNWDLAFETNDFQVGILANHTNGITVYKTPFTVANFGTIDTTGYTQWDSLFNPYQSWDTGAFNIEPDSKVPYDYGWGYYNTSTHHIYGNRTFLIKINQNGTTSFKKFYVVDKYFSWFFRTANIDNSSDVTDTLDSAPYAAKNFVYYNLTTNKYIDREPPTATWDLLFNHYRIDLGMGLGYYDVTGLFTNVGVKTVRATGVNVLTAQASNYDTSAYSHNISTIGWDWANFNMKTYQYDMVDSTVYFVKTKGGNIYKLLFEGFDYIHGVISFGKQLMPAVSGINEVSNTKLLGIYPNPATDAVNLVTNIDNDKMNLRVINSIGQVVKSISLDNMSGLKSTSVDVRNMAQGIYFISLSDDKTVYGTMKFVKE